MSESKKEKPTYPVLDYYDCEEGVRLKADVERKENWKRWGPYLSERQWGTVREDYSSDGSCWDYFPHDQARSRAYRWGEDGLLGITDRECRLCFSVALWNEKDKILKERLFGLTGQQGNHGEDVKECYYYIDATPTYSYMKSLYKYPQAEYPYTTLEDENRSRTLDQREFELIDTGIFNENKYFDVFAEYAKGSPNDVLCKITVVNRGPEEATVHVLPTLVFRNTWIWGCRHEGCTLKPKLQKETESSVTCKHQTLESFECYFDTGKDGEKPELWFTENETNNERLFGCDNFSTFVKDAFHRYLINGEQDAIQTKGHGTKAAAHYVLRLDPEESFCIRVRLSGEKEKNSRTVFSDFEKVFEQRKFEADEFYSKLLPTDTTDDEKAVMRQAYAGLLWSKQFYHYVVEDWLAGDPELIAPPTSRLNGRNAEWKQFFSRDVLSMPDKWEYPWFASWDLAFHMVPFSRVDPDFAKKQLMLLLREWYMSPSGQIPAYEFQFGDVNPPVHAMAAFAVYKMTGKKGNRDNIFLSRCFQKLIMNFTWWVNRKDPEGRNIFSGGFLGLDNIGVFDRSKSLPIGGALEQADGTAWMAFFCIVMLAIALDLAESDPTYEDMASKFFEHFVTIADATNNFGGSGLWDEQDGFYYDHLNVNGKSRPLRVRSLVGLMPLISCLVLEDENVMKLPGFRKRLDWFLKHRKDLSSQISYMECFGDKSYHHLLAIPSKERLVKVLRYMLDEDEFLSPYGIRSLSKFHKDNPYVLKCAFNEWRVDYCPGESNTYLFGGNSNWRGPVWFPINYLLMEALERYDYYYGETLKVECPTGSGKYMRLKDVSVELGRRLSKLFLKRPSGGRPCHGDEDLYHTDPNWQDLILFYEYFDPETGRGCGASHQTGWTALVVNCLEKVAASRSPHETGASLWTTEFTLS